jgi:hypothetical protein
MENRRSEIDREIAAIRLRARMEAQAAIAREKAAIAQARIATAIANSKEKTGPLTFGELHSDLRHIPGGTEIIDRLKALEKEMRFGSGVFEGTEMDWDDKTPIDKGRGVQRWRWWYGYKCDQCEDIVNQDFAKWKNKPSGWTYKRKEQSIGSPHCWGVFYGPNGASFVIDFWGDPDRPVTWGDTNPHTNIWGERYWDDADMPWWIKKDRQDPGLTPGERAVLMGPMLPHNPCIQP